MNKYSIKLSDYVLEHNAQLLRQVVLYTFSDLKRIKAFHDVGEPNIIKRASYISYWWNMRKPFPIITSKNINLGSDESSKMDSQRLLYYNEFFLTAFVHSCIFNKGTILCDNSDTVSDEQVIANDFLFYQFCFRIHSAQHIEAYLTAYQYHPRWQPNDKLIL